MLFHKLFFRLLLITGIVSLIFLFSSQTSYAFTTRTGQDIEIPKSETIDGTLFISGQRVKIDGDVKGDIICAGQTVEINGRVDGDIICGGQTITINSAVNGNIRVGGQTINIDGQVIRNVDAFGQTITSNASVQREFYAAGQTLQLNGVIDGNVQGSAQAANITAKIGKNVNLTVQDLTISPNAKINGNLSYTSSKSGNIAGGSVAGKVDHTVIQEQPQQYREITGSKITGDIISGMIHLLIGLLIIALWPVPITNARRIMMTHAGRSLGIGALLLFITPVVIIAVAVTIIGIPIAILLAIAYGIAIFVSRILVAIVIGRELLDNYWKTKKDSLVWAAIIGIIISWIIFAIPVIGGIASFIAILWGLGGVYYFFRGRPIDFHLPFMKS